jgi:hypothetical protein
MPKNVSTERRYSGINVLILWGAVIERGFSGQSWLTFRQALSLGGNVRKGERGTTVVYADRFVPDDEKKRAVEAGEDAQAIPFLKRFTVFNTDQCDGLPEEVAKTAPPPPPGMVEPEAERLIAATGADFRIGGARAFYSSSDDFVQVPPPQAYFEPINWHRTAFHELGHNAVIGIMPHGLGCKAIRRASTMRRFGIIRALRGTREADRQAGSGSLSSPALRREQGPFLLSACRRGCRSGWSRLTRVRARAQSPFDRRHDGVSPSPCCGEAYAA